MITEKQKKELIEERAGICEVPSCSNIYKLCIHHIIRKNKGGTDNKENLMVLCEKHHKLYHSNEFRCKSK